jgi:hypothetical protein
MASVVSKNQENVALHEAKTTTPLHFEPEEHRRDAKNAEKTQGEPEGNRRLTANLR